MNINTLRRLCNSDIQCQEILFVLSGVKGVCRQGRYKDELPAFEHFCAKAGLFVAKSPFKVIPLNFVGGDGYFEGGLRVSIDDLRKGRVFVFVSRNETLAHLGLYYELINDHINLGKLLGYPKCCTSYFCTNFDEQKTNLELQVRYTAWIDISKRAADAVLLSHFPCNFDCEASVQLAKKYFAVLEKKWPERALKLKKELKLV